MTDGLDQALAGVGLSLLRADVGPPALVVFDGAVSNPTPNVQSSPYVLVYTAIDRPSEHLDAPLSGRSGVWVARWYCHCVGADATAARAVAQRVRTQLLDQRPTVTGLSCGLIRLDESLPPTKDETTGGVVMDAVEVYRLQATS